MRLLLDTHSLLWALADGRMLREEARAQIENPDNTVEVSVASIWELAIKRGTGKISLPGDLLDQIAAASFDLRAITPAHALAAGALPRHHKDPFDRMLVAQAQLEGLTLVTRDPKMVAYEVPRLLA